ncbi:hypothetical protein [Nonomuraea aridisoli]|uniref:DUF4386 family protein n=1 Tax=Nonomuraea aridisoli TaxID=2070368 RepID=A0A2W2DTI4_9ACTN|nr:hypothetical protein [Nonomuraea aridisoli]PZG15312.1 hypothetical protein C1J01_24405 [Nonomuraea aridisoli]
MTASELAGTATPPPAPATASATRRIAVIGLFVLLLVSLAARTFFAFWEPPFDGTVRYDDVRALGGAYWPMNLYLGGPGYAISWVATAVFIVLLAHGRGRALNLLGALLSGVGGILFALTITAEALPFAYAADPMVLPEPAGRELFDILNAHLGLLVPAIVGTQVAIAVGVLAALVGTLLSKAMPRWLSIAGIAYVIVFAALPAETSGPVTAAIVYLLQVTLVAAIGWFGLRAGLGRRSLTPR